MLRIKVLVSAIPLILAAAFAHGGLLPRSHPCIETADASVQLASAPWESQFQVSFTDNPLSATVRVQITDSAASADFAVVDDGAGRDAAACETNARTRLITISARASATAPVIFLSHDGPADYRIFVQSKTFTVREAAALIVGASGRPHRLQAASL